MKLELLKKLIREEMRTVIKEELKDILTEAVTIASTPDESQISTRQKINTESISENINHAFPEETVNTSTGNTLQDMLEMTKRSMSNEEYKNLVSANSSIVQANGIGMNVVSENIQTIGNAGIDLSSLDFVKNAGAIYKASVEKDKQRLGA